MILKDTKKLFNRLVGLNGFVLNRNLTCGKQEPIRLKLYTKANCSLCDQAKNDLDHYYNGQFVIEEVDITESKALFRKFKFDIPVFHYNNEFLMQHKIDRHVLDKLIESIRKDIH
jgi:hypothetical protein